jgi:putative ABC transport system substrate-binding protein
MREHGLVHGEHVEFVRYAPASRTLDDVPAIAARMVASRPDVIIASNPHSVDALARATKTIPIVAIDLESDPVARGWVTSLGRPGGNVTGIFLDIPELSGKQLQFLREAKPDVVGVCVLGDPRINELQFRAIDSAARTAGLAVHGLHIKTVDDIRTALGDAARERAGGIVALTSPLVRGAVRIVAEGALKHRIAAICPFVPSFAEVGGLLAYGPDFPDLFRRSVAYVARILKGAKAADLPVQRPEKFGLALNLRTARTLGLALPAALIQRADLVIE